MLKYAKIMNEETKSVAVGIGSNASFYEKAGMTLQEVEEAYDGSWYLKGYAPQESDAEKAAEIRNKRNLLLQKSDWTQTVDAPLTAEQKSAWANYRQDLRDITAQSGFPDNIVYPETP